MKVILISNNEILNKYTNDFEYIPSIGTTIVYKTFRKNTTMDFPIYDIEYVVDYIQYIIEETWNDHFETVVNVYLTEVDRNQII